MSATSTSSPESSIGSTPGLLPRVAAVWRRWWFAAVIAFLYAYSFPYFEGIRSANELPRIYLTMAMVDRGAFNIDEEIRQFYDTPDTSTYAGKRYSNKAPGMSVLTIPVYWAEKLVHGGQTPKLKEMFFWFRLFGATIPSLLFLLLLWRLLGELIAELALRRWVLAAYAVGTMAWTYGTLFIAHQLSSLLLATSFILIFLARRGKIGYLWPLWAGLAAGSGVLVDYQVGFIGPPLFLYLLWSVHTTSQLTTWRQKLLPALIFCVASGLPILLLGYYQLACFGSPLKTGYHYLTNPVFRSWHSQGFLGLSSFRFSALAGRYFSPDDGLFYYSPFLLLALLGLVLMFRRGTLRAEAVLCTWLVAFFVYFSSSLVFVSGWDVGPRYITCALPYYLVPVAVCVARLGQHAWARSAMIGLMATSMIIYLLVNAVFPHYPDNFSDPFFDVTLRFARAGYLPYNLGWLFGLRGVASLVPYLLVALGLMGVMLCSGPWSWRKRCVVAMGALLVVGAIFSSYAALLSHRRLPVPVRFLPWMDTIWEPRHPGLDSQKLIPAGDPRTGGLKTKKDPWAF